MSKIESPFSHTLIHHFLEESASLYPDKVALIHEDTRATYGEINSQANKVARWLAANNIGCNDRVIILLENSLEYVASYYGILKAGAVAVPLTTDIKPDGLQYLTGQVEPEVIISSARFERILKEVEPDLSGIRGLVLKTPKRDWRSSSFQTVKWEDLLHADNLPDPDIPISDKDLASIIYTSGSSGRPKGVMLSHRNIVANTHSICRYLKLTAADIQMVVLPFFLCHGEIAP